MRLRVCELVGKKYLSLESRGPIINGHREFQASCILSRSIECTLPILRVLKAVYDL
ncbi:hypothetical protein HanPI659440_Chr07g0276321 [Helianthus annuus]|nr:hypothetical protein HanPI659440_Chr07g0276321 [Helianthus annuus]